MASHPQIDAPVTISVPIQWGDQDMFGHVNNVHFLRWFESARIDYLQRCGARMSNNGVGPILAAVQCDYLKQIKFPDTISVGATLASIGNSSLTIKHELWSEHHAAIAARGQSIIVMFDYLGQKPVRISAEIRARISEIQGH
jgi:acyl-CoA thioester hydrolase